MPATNDAASLLEKLDILLKRQELFSKEIDELRKEIYRLQTAETNMPGITEKIVARVENAKQEKTPEPVTIRQVYSEYHERKLQKQPARAISDNSSFALRSNIEKFIGENLINKIGIIITVIGVGIGAKYSIDHQLISPLTRIILGYLVGLALLGFGIKLKKNYLNYSAVLVSGAVAILYFITFAAYSFFELIPQSLAFILMFVFTVLMISAALLYNRQVIGYIGAIGAYAVPFLLSDGSGKVVVLFSYMAIINIGILGIALKKYWKPLYYGSFILTWVIFFSWYANRYVEAQHFTLSLIFTCIFFVTFYGIFIAYKLLQKQKFETDDIILLLSNAFVFYGIGYSVLTNDRPGENITGLFTLANALLHSFAALVIYGRKEEDKNLFYLVGGLALVFITIAIPVQLNGDWVTLLWAFEAALLFWIGRTKQASFYEILSYPLLFLTFFSLVQDWSVYYSPYAAADRGSHITPLLNVHFLTSALCILSLSLINYINQQKKFAAATLSRKSIETIMQFFIPSILLLVIYFSFEVEISNYWNQAWADVSGIQHTNLSFTDSDLYKCKIICIINYSMLFFLILNFVNGKKIRNQNLGWVSFFFSVIFVSVFLTLGLRLLSELRENYLVNETINYPYANSLRLSMRYISLVFLGGTLVSIYQFSRGNLATDLKEKLVIGVDLFLHFCFVWIISSELIAWMDLSHFSSSDKLTISIVWGVYALFLIIRGIWKKKKHLRVGAIILLLVTLIKLFFYDISGLNNITKTIVFVSLGVLLLIISFLYNKYGGFMEGENRKEE
ncbi:MAG: DUF2339 domain-containing protein [Bacteroidota bacterium]